MKFGSLFSPSMMFWGIVGVIRRIVEPPLKEYRQYEKSETVAICLPAHNEEKVIESSIAAIKKIMLVENCFVVSDGSSDQTARVAKKCGAKVLVLEKPHGKALALTLLINHFNLLNKFEYIISVDADTELDINYLRRALPLFDDKSIVAVSGRVVHKWDVRKFSFGEYLVSHRVRLFRLLQIFLTEGWSWKWTNAVIVVPGYASIYRTSILKKIDLYVPGLAIEDFAMAFQIHKKRLGKIVTHRKIVAYDQAPDNLDDYINQVKRWTIGYFQTVRRFGVWPSFFWLSAGVFMIENLMVSVLSVFMPYFLFIIIFYENWPAFWGIVIGYFVIDYLATIYVAIERKKPIMFLYGPFFIYMRVVDSLILLIYAPVGLMTRSDGTWKSPSRR